MNYLVKEDFQIDVGFVVVASDVLNAVTDTNQFLKTLPEILYRSIDFKTAGAVIGAVFCDKLANRIEGASVNPIEKGHPDVIPTNGLNANEETLRNYPQGLEIKGTIGNVRKGANLRAGQKRITELTGITWQAHHREVKHLMGFIWDFNDEYKNFHFPIIVGVFYFDELELTDWGEISGTTGRNTKVSGMLKSGKEKMGKGWVVMLNDEEYLEKLRAYLNIIEVKE